MEDGQCIKRLMLWPPKGTITYSELFTPSGRDSEGYTLRNENYKFIKLSSGSEYLYKLRTDSFEKNKSA